MPKILITDCWTRKSLSAVRSLGKMGVRVDAISHTRIAPGIYSKYTNKYYIVPDPKKKPQQYLLSVLQLLQHGNYDCIMPFEESSIEIFLEARTDIEKLTVLPIASAKAYHTANNKWKILQLAEQLSIPMPKSFCPTTDGEVTAALTALDYPIIIKPITSSGSRGLKKAYSKEEFDNAYPSIVKDYGYPLIQDYIPKEGEGCGVGLLAKEGEMLVSFSYKRLREFPINGGPSTLRESTDDAELKQYAAALIKALNWTGVAMVEFKRDPQTGIPKLMEINPRFWGSLDLAEVAGINFPFLLFQLSQNMQVQQLDYKKGVMCRWLLPGDIAHFLANPKRFSLRPSFFDFFNKNIFYDDFKKDDMKGNIAVVLCTFAMVFDPSVWKMGIFRK